MSDRDAMMSDVTVVLDARYIDQPKTGEAVELIKGLGMDVREVDENISVVEGTIATCKIHDLEKLDCVDYVRVCFTYVADYPAGDRRDVPEPR